MFSDNFVKNSFSIDFITFPKDKDIFIHLLIALIFCIFIKSIHTYFQKHRFKSGTLRSEYVFLDVLNLNAQVS